MSATIYNDYRFYNFTVFMCDVTKNSPEYVIKNEKTISMSCYDPELSLSLILGSMADMQKSVSGDKKTKILFLLSFVSELTGDQYFLTANQLSQINKKFPNKSLNDLIYIDFSKALEKTCEIVAFDGCFDSPHEIVYQKPAVALLDFDTFGRVDFSTSICSLLDLLEGLEKINTILDKENRLKFCIDFGFTFFQYDEILKLKKSTEFLFFNEIEDLYQYAKKSYHLK